MQQENETYFLNPDYASLEVNIISQLSTKTCDVQPSNSTTLPTNIETPVGKTTPEDSKFRFGGETFCLWSKVLKFTISSVFRFAYPPLLCLLGSMELWFLWAFAWFRP